MTFKFIKRTVLAALLAAAGASPVLAAPAGDAAGGESAAGPEVGGGPAGLESRSATRNGPHGGPASGPGYRGEGEVSPSTRQNMPTDNDLQNRPTR